MDETLEAMLYDWHNEHLLRDQRRDIAYWIRHTQGLRPLLVLGAGTGRVAVPLAEADTGVIALDQSIGRLKRIPTTSGLFSVCADMRQVPLADSLAAVLLPYSTLQAVQGSEQRQLALDEAARLLSPGAHLFIDVSHSFEFKSVVVWHRVLRAACAELQGKVLDEWQIHIPLKDRLQLLKMVQSDGETLGTATEQWAYASSLDLPQLLADSGFDIVQVDRGYGDTFSHHREIYHAIRV